MLALPSIAHPVLVAFKADGRQKATLSGAAQSFKGDGTINGFRATDGGEFNQVARRFNVPVKKGQMAVPAVRFVVGDLVEGRSYTIDRAPVTGFAVAPR